MIVVLPLRLRDLVSVIDEIEVGFVYYMWEGYGEVSRLFGSLVHAYGG